MRSPVAGSSASSNLVQTTIWTMSFSTPYGQSFNKILRSSGYVSSEHRVFSSLPGATVQATTHHQTQTVGLLVSGPLAFLRPSTVSFRQRSSSPIHTSSWYGTCIPNIFADPMVCAGKVRGDSFLINQISARFLYRGQRGLG